MRSYIVVRMSRGCVLVVRSVTESRKQHEEKQAKAQELREKLQQERGENLRMLTKKVSFVQFAQTCEVKISSELFENLVL